MRRLGKGNVTGLDYDPPGRGIQVNYIPAEGGKAVGAAADLIAPGEIDFQLFFILTTIRFHRHP